jgi:hypothetical protein
MGIMRIITTAGFMIGVLTLGHAADGVAQVWLSGSPAPSYVGNHVVGQQPMYNAPAAGLFGSRSVAQMLTPPLNRFAPGVTFNRQTGQAIGPSTPDTRGMMFTAPPSWQYGNSLPPALGYDQGGVFVPALQAAQAAPYAGPAGAAPPAAATPVSPAVVEPVMPQGTYGPEMTAPGGENNAAPGPAEMEQAAIAAPVAVSPPPHGWSGISGGAARDVGPWVRSPELSARITRLARSGGIRAPSGITVSLGNGTAVLQGTVGSAGDRAMLSTLVGMEPGIWHVDNRLSVGSQQEVAARTPQQK